MIGHPTALWYYPTMTKKLALRTLSVFVVATTSNVGLGAFVNVAVWKSAVMAGAVAVVDIAHKLAVAYRDGTLTDKELRDIFE